MCSDPVVKRKLNYTTVDRKALWTEAKRRIIYIEVVESGVYERHTNGWLESAKIGLGIGKKLSDFFVFKIERRCERSGYQQVE
jgi:hypothetical protein